MAEVKKCFTGQSKSGICGAAAYCAKPYKCCAECDKPCNSRCGWLGRQVQAKQGAECGSYNCKLSDEDFKNAIQKYLKYSSRLTF